MTLAMLKKEFALCLHPAAIVFVLFGAFVFIPNYPYEVMFFFSGLGAYFICLSARENGDLEFGCTLPVNKTAIPVARILMCVNLQLAQLLTAAMCIALKEAFFPAPNLAGMDANIALLGWDCVILGAVNICFFPIHFRDPKKVGKPFCLATVVVFLLIVLSVMLCTLSPSFWAGFDTPDPQNIFAKLTVLFSGIALYVWLTACALILSCKAFSKVDL